MFRIITLASLILHFAVVATAQESSSNKILNRFELVAGPSFSNNKGYLPDHDSKTGYSIGIGYYQKLSKSFHLNFRTLYESKGTAATYQASVANTNGSFDNIDDKYTSEFKYLTFYLLPTLKLTPKKNIHIGAGGYYSILQSLSVTSHRTSQDTGDLIWHNTRTDESFFTPDYDAGVSVQIGYSFKVSDNSRLMLQAFSNWGLVDLHSNWIGSHRNNNLGLLLSFKLQ